MMNDAALLKAIKEKLPEIKSLLSRLDDHWGLEDAVYRFYHQSFKVYYLKSDIKDAIQLFRQISVDALKESELNATFTKIVAEGLEKTFDAEKSNANWLSETRPILEAAFHVRYMLAMMAKYGQELMDVPNTLPSGWASVLYLFNSR